MTSARSCNLFPALHRFVMSGGTIDVGRIDVMDCGSVNKSSDNRGDSHETCNEVPPNLGPHAPGAAKMALRSGIVTPFRGIGCANARAAHQGRAPARCPGLSATAPGGTELARPGQVAGFVSCERVGNPKLHCPPTG